MDLQERIKKGWEISAEGYSKNVVPDDFLSPAKEVWTELILSKAPAGEKLKILDIGTGPGVFPTLLTLAGHDVTGIDISPKMLEQAKMNSAKYGVEPEYLVMDSQNLEFDENTFDLIISRNVVWIMEYPEKAYSSWLKCLKPGGKIIVFDSGHGKDDFLSQFDLDNEGYIRDYREKHGEDPKLSFEPGQYEIARGWKKELKLSHVERPAWDVQTLKELGYADVEWDNVAGIVASVDKSMLDSEKKVFFRLCGTKI